MALSARNLSKGKVKDIKRGQGMAQKTIDGYSRGVRRISEYFDFCPDQLTLERREEYFSALVELYSWSTFKIDRNGLQFFWKHVLNRDWQWINIVKASKCIRSLIFSPSPRLNS